MTHEHPGDSAKPRIGVVLSSGGVRGVFAHTGFMMAIQSLGISITAASGCSAGALVGGFLASGTALDDWLSALAKLDSKVFWTPDTLSVFLWKMAFQQGRGYTGLSDTSAALRFTSDNLAVESFEECLYPFHALAINLGSGEKELFSQGEMAPRLTASAAIPILYQPVEIDGEYYCDGAVVDFAPTDAICCRHELDVVIIHHVSQLSACQDRNLGEVLSGPWAMLEVFNRLLFRERPWYLSGNRPGFHFCPCGCGAILIVAEPELPDMRWPSVEGGDVVLKRSQAQAEAMLRPYLHDLSTNPRRSLAALVDLQSGVAKDSGSGHQAVKSCIDTASKTH